MARRELMKGVVLVPGSSGKKWTKRILAQQEVNSPFLYYLDKDLNEKGMLDLSSVSSVQTATYREYFVLELRTNQSKTGFVKFAAMTAAEQDYWYEGIQHWLNNQGTGNNNVVIDPVILESLGRSTSNLVASGTASNAKLRTETSVPPLYPGEELVHSILGIRLEDGSFANCFLTNFKVHVVPVTAKLHKVDLSLPDHMNRVNYHSVPIAAIYKAEKSEKSEKFEIYSRDLRRVTMKFKNAEQDYASQILAHLTKYSPGDINLCDEQMFASQFFAKSDDTLKSSMGDVHFKLFGYLRYNMKDEFSRLGVPNNEWRICELNMNIKKKKKTGAATKLIPSYPSYLAVPDAVKDSVIKKVTKFRTRKRIPALSWLHGNGAALCRSSQPRMLTSMMTSQKKEEDVSDESYLQYFINRHKANSRLMILDARSEKAAQANRAVGGGFEEGYKNCKVIFNDIENIHTVRASWKALMKLCEHGASVDDYFWNLKLQECGWLSHLGCIMRASLRCVVSILEGDSVLVHCSDGWDRTSQMTSLAMLMLDPHYRTINGFELLIEKEWLSFGHQMCLRNGISGSCLKTSNEEAPIFLQFLECVRYLLVTYPTAFEFNEEFLVTIFDNLYTNCFGTFLYDNELDRMIAHNRGVKHMSLWCYIDKYQRDYYVNKWYSSIEEVLIPNFELQYFPLWTRLWFRWDPQQRSTHFKISAKIHELESLFLEYGGKPEELKQFANRFHIPSSGLGSALDLKRKPSLSPNDFQFSSTSPKVNTVPIRLTTMEEESDSDDFAEVNFDDGDGEEIEKNIMQSTFSTFDQKAEQNAAQKTTKNLPLDSLAQPKITDEKTVMIEQIRKRKLTKNQLSGIPQPTDVEVDLTDELGELMETNDESFKQNISLNFDEEEMKLLNNDTTEIDDEFIVGLLAELKQAEFETLSDIDSHDSRSQDAMSLTRPDSSSSSSLASAMERRSGGDAGSIGANRSGSNWRSDTPPSSPRSERANPIAPSKLPRDPPTSPREKELEREQAQLQTRSASLGSYKQSLSRDGSKDTLLPASTTTKDTLPSSFNPATTASERGGVTTKPSTRGNFLQTRSPTVVSRSPTVATGNAGLKSSADMPKKNANSSAHHQQHVIEMNANYQLFQSKGVISKRRLAQVGRMPTDSVPVPTDDQIIQFKISQNSDYQGLDDI